MFLIVLGLFFSLLVFSLKSILLGLVAYLAVKWLLKVLRSR